MGFQFYFSINLISQGLNQFFFCFNILKKNLLKSNISHLKLYQIKLVGSSYPNLNSNLKQIFFLLFTVKQSFI